MKIAISMIKQVNVMTAIDNHDAEISFKYKRVGVRKKMLID